MNIFLVIVIVGILVPYFLDVIANTLNVRAIKDNLPAEFRNYLDDKRYAASQSYLKENAIFSTISNTFSTFLLIIFILIGGFNYLDIISRRANSNEIVIGLIYIFLLSLLSKIADLPFSIYRTFTIEKKYGFNKTTPKLFLVDLVKGILLQIIIGGFIFAVILVLFENLGSLAWIFAWITVSVIQIFLVFIAPIVIMPLFNKFTPLEDGKLRQEIERFAKDQNFKLSGIFTMDGSKRSTKSNAYFTGFGKFKRIVLFDTLIKNHSTKELVAILAHEIGHYKLGHIRKLITISILSTGLMFFSFSLLIENKKLFEAFRMEHLSIYASIIFISILYIPISSLVSFLVNILSRKFEYQADRFAVTQYKKPKTFIHALKVLSVDNLTNLNPHKLYVLLNYSHPPVLDRINTIKKMSK